MYVSGHYSSVAEIARVLGIKRGDTVRNWAKQDGWERLKNDLTDVAVALHGGTSISPMEQLKVFVAQTVNAALERHIGHAVEIQEKALQALRGLPVRTLQDAMAMFEYGVGLERVSRNLAPPGGKGGGGGGGSEGALSADAILSAFVRVANSNNTKVPVVVVDGRKAEDAATPGPEDGAIPPEVEGGGPDEQPAQ